MRLAVAKAAAASLACLIIAGCASTVETATDGASSENARIASLAADVEARGDYDTAAVLYARAAQTSGATTEIQLRLANAHLKSANYPAAQDAYSKVLAADSKNAEALLGLGTVQLKRGEAEAGARTLALACPAVNTASACNRLGTALILIGRFDAAFEAFERARGLAPEDLDTLTNIALAQALLGRTDDAIGTMQAVVQSPLTQSRHRANLVLVYGLARRMDEAKAVTIPDMTPAQRRDLLTRAKKAGEAQDPRAKARAIGLLSSV